MLDANDIQVIKNIMNEVLRDNNGEIRTDLETLLSEESKRTDENLSSFRKQIREDFRTVIESEVNPKLQILAEGHELLLEKITPASEIKEMKADIVVLKEAVQHLSQRMNELQKAQ